MSASAPQTNEPTAVPTRAQNGSIATVALPIAYSLRMPGVTKPRLAGFMMSMMRATERTAISSQCAAVSGASSGGAMAMKGSWAFTAFGSSP